MPAPVAARRWAELASTGCAFVESRDGIVKRAVRSAGFRGVAVGKRKLEEQALAVEMARTGRASGTRVHTTAWGVAKAKREIVEECVPLDERGAVLSWLWHA
jgi:hypothetical protein